MSLSPCGLIPSPEHDPHDDDPSSEPPAPPSAASSSTGLLYFPPAPAPAPRAQRHAPDIPPPRIAPSYSLDEAPEAGPWSLLDEMRAQHQGAHAGPKERIALYGFPAYLSTNIRRVLSRSRTGTGEWSVALSCLVWRGLCRFNAHSTVRGLTELLQELDNRDDLNAIESEQVESWRRGLRYGIVDPTFSLGLEKVRGWKAPEHVHAELHDAAGRVGLSGSVLGVACVMVALVEPQAQEGVIAEHAGHMRVEVERLDGLLAERERRLRRLVRAIEAGVWR